MANPTPNTENRSQNPSENPSQVRRCTLLELVTELSREIDDESEVVEKARAGLLDGRFELTGNFRGREASFAA